MQLTYNNKDYDILDHYVTYTTASNKKRLFSIISLHIQTLDQEF